MQVFFFNLVMSTDRQYQDKNNISYQTPTTRSISTAEILRLTEIYDKVIQNHSTMFVFYYRSTLMKLFLI